MKNFLIILLALLMCVSVFAACDKKPGGSEEETTTAAPVEDTPNDTVVIPEKKLQEGDYYFLLNEDRASYSLGKYVGNGTTLELPETAGGLPVTAIMSKAFKGNKTLKAVKIGENFVEIGNEAFSGCTALATVSIANSVAAIGHSAFLDTPWLNGKTAEFVIVGDGVLIKYNGLAAEINVKKSLGVKYISDAFAGNKGIFTVVIDPGVLYVGERAFADCISLKKIVFPVEMKKLASSAFDGCTSLTTIEQTVGEYGGGEF